MADNANVTQGDGTIIVATDKIGGIDYQRIKVTWGGDGTATDASAAAPMPVETSLGKAEDAVHASGDTGVMLLAVRKDTAAALAGTDGDYIPLIVAADGSLWIKSGQLPTALAANGGLKIEGIAGGVSVPVTLATALDSANDSVNVGKIAGQAPPTADYDSGAGTATTAMLGIALPASGGPVAGGTATNPFRTDPIGSTTQPVDTELPAAAALADGAANPTAPAVGAFGMRYNGATWDEERGNTEFTILASAARTATTNSADFTNHNARGILILLNITVASGTGGLQLRVQAKDVVSSAYYSLNAAPTAVIATGITAYMFIPGISAGALTQNNGIAIPRTFRIAVSAGDSSSYTYSVGGHYLV